MPRASSLLVPLALLAACEGPRPDAVYSLGLTRDGADQFEVTTRPPLVLPPDYSTLPPPGPVEQRAPRVPAPQQAAAVLAPQVALNADAGALSPGQIALLNAAGPPAPPDLRVRVDHDALQTAPPQSILDRLAFWSAPKTQGDPVVDPRAEALRLNQPLPAPATVLEPAPPPARRGIFGGIFDGLF